MKGVGAAQSGEREAVLGGGVGEEGGNWAARNRRSGAGAGAEGGGRWEARWGAAGDEEKTGNWEGEAASATWAVSREPHLSRLP